MMHKLREDDRLQREEERLRQAGTNDALQEENERLRQRLERIEKAQHSGNVHAEGDRSRPAEQPQPDRERNEPQRERQAEISRRDDQDATSRRLEDSADHHFPLTDDILATKFPPNWNNPTLDKYDGTTDPDEHIDSYVSQLTLFTTDGYIYCKVFPTSLRGAALSWFTHLPPGSIDSFATLKAKFVAQFATSKPHQMTSVTLVNIRQEKGESLKSFMARFGQVALSICGLLPEVAMAYLITALRPGPFADSLAMQPPANMDDLRRRATQFMHVEELRQYSRGEQGQGRKGDRSSNPPRFRDTPGTQRFTKYTPLNTGRTCILEEALSVDLIKEPKRGVSPYNADRSKYCQYHRCYGHTTGECAALKDKIEELIQVGHMQRYVARR